MEDAQFDTLAKTTAHGGRRSLLKSLSGGLAGALLVVSSAANTKAKSKGKKRKTGAVSAAAKEKGCCCTCPPTGNECSVAVCEASTQQCVEVEVRSGLPCANDGGYCVHGFCLRCESGEELCPDLRYPSGTGFLCAPLLSSNDDCGACGNRCPAGTNCSDGQCT